MFNMNVIHIGYIRYGEIMGPLIEADKELTELGVAARTQKRSDAQSCHVLDSN
jgi:hypothetical protein